MKMVLESINATWTINRLVSDMFKIHLQNRSFLAVLFLALLVEMFAVFMTPQSLVCIKSTPTGVCV